MKKKSVPKALGEVLALAREKTGLNQADFAARVGLATESYARIERGESDARASTVAALAKELRVSANVLLGLEVEPASVISESPAGYENLGVARQETRRLRGALKSALRAVASIESALGPPGRSR
jgi:transcriptional regulator with XRE-family HTH domain